MNVTQLVQDMTLLHVTETHLWVMFVIRTAIALALVYECTYRLSHMGGKAKWQIHLAVVLMMVGALGILLCEILPVGWPEYFKWPPGLIPNELGLYLSFVMYYMQFTTRRHWKQASETCADGRALPNSYRKEPVARREIVEGGTL